jgi:Uncharacterized alpha/beta hydrolase domain (DUF2235)
MADLKTVKPPAEKKRLAVFMDGTTDTSEGNTNVWRARSLCAPHGTNYVPKSQTGPFVSPRELKDAEQRWFSGAHGDVGGGSSSDPLAQIPLKWLLSKASEQGLAFRRDIEIDNEAATGSIEDSFSDFLGGAYKVLRFGQRSQMRRDSCLNAAPNNDLNLRSF